QAATWHFSIPSGIDPATIASAFVRIAVAADDHGTGVRPRRALVWTNGAFVVSPLTGLPHGSPGGTRFTNWATFDFPIDLAPQMTVTIANASAAGPGDWIAIDWIELHLNGAT